MPTIDELVNSITPRADPPPVNGSGGKPPPANVIPNDDENMEDADKEPAANQTAQEKPLDLMNGKNKPNNGPTGNDYNIDEPGFDWLNAPITLTLPTTYSGARSCRDNCMEAQRQREERCKLVKRRMEIALKGMGCSNCSVGTKSEDDCGCQSGSGCGSGCGCAACAPAPASSGCGCGCPCSYK